MGCDFVTALLPAIASSVVARSNVFDVVRHGDHEKQVSNVFASSLDDNGTHDLGALFAEIFVGQVNGARPGFLSLPLAGYSVEREVWLRDDEGVDVADIILEQAGAAITQGWEQSVVLTEESMLRELVARFDADGRYGRRSPDACWFIEQMHGTFEEGTPPMSGEGLLDFILAMCDTGEAGSISGL